MQETYEEGIPNWCLPLNHGISSHGKGGLDFYNVANVARACRRLGGPFDPSTLA